MSRYNQKMLVRKKSGTIHALKKRRNLALIIWLAVCIAIGAGIYFGYSKENMSDTPIKSVGFDGGVTTGNELLEDVPFGPWMAE